MVQRMKVKVIGVGGIGCCLLPCLARFLQYQLDVEASVTLIDGDAFENRNRERQTFSALGNKASVKVAELQREFPRMYFEAVEEFITEDNVMIYIQNSDVVFVGVDNFFSRKVISDRAIRLKDVLVISGGNELTDGNVRFHLRQNNEDITLPLANKYHPEVMNPRDTGPTIAGCGARQAADPQIVLMNNLVAAHMLAGFYAYLQGKLDYDEVYLDLLTGSSRSVKRKK